MAAPDPHFMRATCPVCRGRNVLVVAVTATDASVYCLSCEHLFAHEIPPGREPAAPPAPPSGRPSKRRTVGLATVQHAA